MDLDQLTDEEKSVLLAKVMGWEWIKQKKVYGFTRNWWHLLDAKSKRLKRTQVHWVTEKNEGLPVPGRWQDRYMLNLYDPAYMALAWRVLNWAQNYNDRSTQGLSGHIGHWLTYPPSWLWKEPEAQRLWLDKILELAIEAGLVELEEERG